jgi:hypothetical protein
VIGAADVARRSSAQRSHESLQQMDQDNRVILPEKLNQKSTRKSWRNRSQIQEVFQIPEKGNVCNSRLLSGLANQRSQLKQMPIVRSF